MVFCKPEQDVIFCTLVGERIRQAGTGGRGGHTCHVEFGSSFSTVLACKACDSVANETNAYFHTPLDISSASDWQMFTEVICQGSTKALNIARMVYLSVAGGGAPARMVRMPAEAPLLCQKQGPVTRDAASGCKPRGPSVTAVNRHGSGSLRHRCGRGPPAVGGPHRRCWPASLPTLPRGRA
jgi:hypothetical protein